MTLVKLVFSGDNPITDEVNDALNLWGIYGLVVNGEMSQEDYDKHVAEFEAKYDG
jgi:hypothetical protein